jgi:hypothetical protein
MIVHFNLCFCKVKVEDSSKNNEAPMLRTLPHSRIVLSIIPQYSLIFPVVGWEKYNRITGVCSPRTVLCYQLVCLVIADDATNHFLVDTLRTVSI